MSLKNLQGRVAWVFDEDNYDIDLIIGIKNIKLSDLEELASVAMVAPSLSFGPRISDAPPSPARRGT